MIYELKIILEDAGAPVWRVIQIDSSATFYDLHRVIQVVFDWDNYHLHGFTLNQSSNEQVENVEICLSSVDNPNRLGVYNEKELTLSDGVNLSIDNLSYLYDFKDNWNHKIRFMKKLKAEQKIKYPRCIDAANRTPGEDSRSEALMGGVDLQFKYSNDSLEEINEELRFQLPDLVAVVEKNNAAD